MSVNAPIRPLESEEDYDRALAEAEKYFAAEPDPGTPEGDRFEALMKAIGEYEKVHHPVLDPGVRE